MRATDLEKAVVRFLRRMTCGAALLACLAAFLPAPALALSGELTGLLNSIGRNLKANQSGKLCEPQLFAEVGVSLEHVTRSLKDLVVDGDVSDKHEAYEGLVAPHAGVGGGVQATSCTGKFRALWVIKPGTQADAGVIRIFADVSACPCKSTNDLKQGQLNFTVPITRSIDISGTESFSAGAPRDFNVVAECCNRRKIERTGAEEAPATAVARPVTTTPKPAPVVSVTPPPATVVPPPVATPKPPPKPEPVVWTVEKPCPACQSWKDYLDKTLAELAALQQEQASLAAEMTALGQAIADKQKQIESLRTQIRLQEGTGGSASDYPQPGWTTSSITQADGRVKITVTDASGREVEVRYRERRDLERLRQQITDLEAQIAQDRQKQDQAKQRAERVRQGMASKQKQAEVYRQGLADCIRERCQLSDSTPRESLTSPPPPPVPVDEPPVQSPKEAEPVQPPKTELVKPPAVVTPTTPVPVPVPDKPKSAPAPVTDVAKCMECENLVRQIQEHQTRLVQEQAVLDDWRKTYTDILVQASGDLRVLDAGNDVVQNRASLIAANEERIRTQAKKVADFEAAMEKLRSELAACNKRCDAPMQKQSCTFPEVKPIIIGPREQYGYGSEQKAAKVGKAVVGILGGFLGGGGGGLGGGDSFSGASEPDLVNDPVDDDVKRTFTDPQTGTAIEVGGLVRDDGSTVVSVNVDKSEDQGVVHQVVREQMRSTPSGTCEYQRTEADKWLHYAIWEDWWAKIRITRYESVNGGPWKKTHDSGWQDYGSGSRLLETGVMRPDQIGGTGWGSMGGDRAFGAPRSAGAVFDPPKIAMVEQPGSTAERVTVHVTQPGKDPVVTVPFTLYPAYDKTGISYSDVMPAGIDVRGKMGGGMVQIDPPATTQARESILDDIGEHGPMTNVPPPPN